MSHKASMLVLAILSFFALIAAVFAAVEAFKRGANVVGSIWVANAVVWANNLRMALDD